ncbi:MAG: DegT/DnrJ/EryC1/StrS family aminotransferase [Candidatus Omnitrophota bacterium]
MYRIGEEELRELRKVLESKNLFRVGDPKAGHLQEVERFEREWAEKIGTKYALLLSGGGTAALMCGLAGMGIGPGDEVLIPAYTFMASASAVLAVGAIPVVAEIDDTCTIDPEDMEKKITPGTKAIIPVHMVGIPCNMQAITGIAKKAGIKVLEDSCQADGGSFKSKRLGAWGDAGAFSFNYYKILSCGEGGCLVTNDKLIYERASIFGDSGTAFRSYAGEFSVPIFVGLQLRASEVMGAIMRIQLQRLEGILSDLRRIKKRFIGELSGKPGIAFSRSNDIEGDCGVVVSFRFENEEKARSFASYEGVSGWRPLDSEKHVFFNWEPIVEKRIWHHPIMNPYNFPQNKKLRLNYTKEMYPKSLDNLGRTVFVHVNPDWTEEEVKNRIEACEKAAVEINT